jgi:hypothetical protein
MIDKSIIGKEYPPFTVEVEKHRVRSLSILRSDWK